MGLYYVLGWTLERPILFIPSPPFQVKMDATWLKKDKQKFSALQTHKSALATTFKFYIVVIMGRSVKTRSSWLNCALRDDEAVYWASIGHYEAVAVGN